VLCRASCALVQRCGMFGLCMALSSRKSGRMLSMIGSQEGGLV
jgi:hypothetical protein